MKLSVLQDMPVVSVADGTKVGAVQDILVDTAQMRVVTLVLSGDGGTSWLPFESIRHVGGDAVTVESAAVTQGASGQAAADGLRGLKELTSLKVVNEAGTYLGEVQDVDFDARDGRIGELIARRGGVLGGLGATDTRVPVAAIRGMGPAIVTVDLPVAPS